MDNFSLLQWLNFINENSFTQNIGKNDILKFINGVTTYTSSDFENVDYFYIYDALNANAFTFTASDFSNQDLFKIYDKIKNGNEAYLNSDFSNQDFFNIYNDLNIYDADAVAFMSATLIPDDGTIYFPSTPQEITGSGLWSAVNTLTKEIKAANAWDISKGIYPMVGGSVFTHKWNLKSPLDLDSSFRLAFFGTLVHSGTGILPNGVNGKANTFINCLSELGLNDTFFGFYSGTDVTSWNYNDMGARLSSDPSKENRLYSRGGAARLDVSINSANTSVSVPNSLGWSFSKMDVSGQMMTYRNAVRIANLPRAVNAQPNNDFNLMASSWGAGGGASIYYSIREQRGAHIGSGTLSNDDALALATAWINFNTTLGRA